MREIIQKGSSIVWAVEVLVDVARDRDKWRGLVNTLMNLQVRNNARNFFSKLTMVTFTTPPPKKNTVPADYFVVHKEVLQ
jgi:hypothetical protein